MGVDVGGTFTDVIGYDKCSGRIHRVKVLSTPSNPALGVIRGLEELLAKTKCRVEELVHASTIGSNLFLGQVGLTIPKTALITTKGFRDLVEIGRQRRPELYNVFFTKPKPLVLRRLRFTVNERISYDGRIIKPLDPEEVVELARKLKDIGVESIAVSLLHSYANPVHEELIEKILSEELPGTPIVLSSRVDPEYREYERTSTTVVNAVLIPVISRYLRGLVEEVKRKKIYDEQILIMKSDGGFADIDEAIRIPVATIESGPAAGVVASTFIASMLSIEDALSFDMGGTTAKVSTIVKGKPTITTEYEVGGRIHRGRLVRGSGYPVRYPHIDLVEVSAGGGTIVWVDEAGHLRVGPISAGSDPGPACYGRGGAEPTITDANFLLGRLSETLAGGKIKLSRELALKTFAKILEKTGLGLEEAAYGAIKLANTEMARAARIITIERGFDPRDFTLIAYGGAGPMHAAELAEELGVTRIIIPVTPGLFSALGLLLADYRYEYKKSLIKTIDEVKADKLEEAYVEIEERAVKLLRSKGLEDDRIVIVRYADMRYRFQSYELLVEVPKPITTRTLEVVAERFISRHKEVYGYDAGTRDIVIVNIRVTAIGLVDKPRIEKTVIKSYRKLKPSDGDTIRKIYFESTGWIETPVYRRDKLRPGDIVEGPCVVEEYDSTIVVPPDWVLRVNEYDIIEVERR